MQRLFSTFPSNWPGIGLLLLRACLAIALIYFAVAGLWNPPDTILFVKDLIAAAGGLFLLAGLWTPVMGVLVAVDEVWIAFSRFSQRREDMWVHMFLAVLSVSVAMLGPGAWSIDARLFGRKRLDIDRSRNKRRSL